ncbi:hypothetical protein IQ07DRAFT_203345 [Pyrenochaeta sp. DS3sAY3a]|nr:hypothetical protein IQ07DRAFT_203345 [Pyrenochaeta sp. DS3sAY3a]
MATPPTLPGVPSAALQTRFNNLANDDERRGFLAFYQRGIFLGFRGANLIRYGWDQLSEADQQNYIDEALQADEDQAEEDQADEDQADEDQEELQEDEDQASQAHAQASQHLSIPSSPPEMPTPRAGPTIRIQNRSVLVDNEVARESEDVEVQQQGEDNEGPSQGEDYENEPPFEGFSDAQQDEDSEAQPHPEDNEGVPIGQTAERIVSSVVNSRKRKQQSDDLSLQSEERGTTSYKPSRGTVENTVEAWDEFIRNHPEQVEAMGIHPDWEWVWATTIAARGGDYHKTVMVWVALDENNRVREVSAHFRLYNRTTLTCFNSETGAEEDTSTKEFYPCSGEGTTGVENDELL